MNLLIRAKLLILSGVLALGGLGVAAPAAHASSPAQIYPYGGPGQVTVFDNGGFTPNRFNGVRLEALTLDWRLLATLWVNVNACGNLTTSSNLVSCAADPANYARFDVPYVGRVIIMADQYPGLPQGPVASETDVYPLFTINATASSALTGPGPLHPSCEVHVNTSNFQATSAEVVLVRVFAVDGTSWHQLDWTNASGSPSFSVTLTPQPWTSGVTYHVTADPNVVGQPAETTVQCPPL